MQNEWNQFIQTYLAKEHAKHQTFAFSQPVQTALPNGLQLTLRLEAKQDWREVEELTRRAFWDPARFEQLGGIGADEHYLAHTLRTAPEFVAALDFVAQIGNKLVGNVMYCIAYVQTEAGEQRPVLIFGPLCVHPAYQHTGVGGALMRHTIEVAKRLGYGGILFFGHPEYYPRLGFVPAQSFGVKTREGESFPAFMGMELQKGYLHLPGGRFFFSPLYEPPAQAACAFDRRFAPFCAQEGPRQD